MIHLATEHRKVKERLAEPERTSKSTQGKKYNFEAFYEVPREATSVDPTTSARAAET